MEEHRHINVHIPGTHRLFRLNLEYMNTQIKGWKSYLSQQETPFAKLILYIVYSLFPYGQLIMIEYKNIVYMYFYVLLM